MKLNARRYGDYGFVTLEVENTTIDLGTLNNKELQILLENLKAMVEDVEWLVHVTLPKE